MTVDLKAKFDELEARRRFHIDGVDQAVEAMAGLRRLDRQLFELGLHEELQLQHVESVDPPLEELPEFQDDEATPPEPTEAGPVRAAEASTPADGSKPLTGKNRFTDEERAEAVRLADELGSDNAAGKQLGMHAGSIANWRAAGHGKRPKSVNGTAEKRGAKVQPAHDGPQVPCKVCKASVPIEGEPNQVNRLAATQRHWRDSPECGEAMRKRHA